MKKVLRLSLVVLLLAILGSAGFIFYSVFFGGESVVVPPMVGSSVLDAVETVENMGLQVRVDQEDSLQPRGTIIAQWPKSGVKIKKEKILILKVSKGGYKEPLPDLRGMEFSKATSKLRDLDFPLGNVIRIHDNKPAGMVIAQNPAAPVMISRTRTVSLLVSIGPESTRRGMVKVPDILGKDEESARKLLDKSGLSTTIQYVYTQASPPGIAISMTPGSGKSVSVGSRITLKVSTLNSSSRVVKRPEVKKETTARESTSKVRLPGSPSTPGAVIKPVQDRPSSTSSSGGAKVILVKPAQTTPVSVPKPDVTPLSKPVESSNSRKKIARIRYQVPPVTKPLSLKIEMIDKGGSRVLVNKDVNGGEYISLNTPYAGDAAVTIYLGGEFVWQDRYR